MKKLANILRLFWGCVFMAGGVFNLVITVINKIFSKNGGTSTFQGLPHNFLNDTVWPNLTLFGALLGTIALVLGLLMLSKGKFAKVGLFGAVLFGVGFILLELDVKGWDWLWRMPTSYLVFEAMIIYCLFFNYDKTALETIRRKKETITAVIGS